jgi:hypothetical protein
MIKIRKVRINYDLEELQIIIQKSFRTVAPHEI